VTTAAPDGEGPVDHYLDEMSGLLASVIGAIALWRALRTAAPGRG
jgi:hypothetical protein